MKQEHKEKIRKTKQENRKKILEICGYEIWRDPFNYTTIKDGKNLYFSTFKNALIDIRYNLIRNKLENSKTLETAINRILEVDEIFLKALLDTVDKLGRK